MIESPAPAIQRTERRGNATSYTLPTGAGARAVYSQGVDCPNAAPGSAFLPHCTISPQGDTTEYTYDVNGNRTGETIGGNTQTWAYESDGSVCGGVAGQICSATDGNGNATSYEYDGGNLLTVTPPGPLSSTTYTYDLSSRVTSVTVDGTTTSYQYDRWDNVVFTRFGTDNTADTITYDIDATGTLHSTRWNQNITRYQQYEYDPLGFETSRIIQENEVQVASSTATYDAIGNMTTYTTANGTVTATYDAANQLTALAEPGASCPQSALAPARCVRFEYDADGNETTRLFPGGASQNNAYDASNRLTRVTARSGTERDYQIQYSYTTPDGADSALIQNQVINRAPIENQPGPTDPETRARGVDGPGDLAQPTVPTSQFTTTYSYDAQARLTNAVERQFIDEFSPESQTAEWTYAYDANDNMTSRGLSGDNPGGAVTTTTYTYNAANQITASSADTTTWAYDANGQVTRNGITGVEHTYGQRDEVTSIGTTDYDSFGQGNTITTADSTGDTFDITALGVMQRTAPNTATNYLRTTTGDLVGFDNTVDSYYYVTDIRGSVVGLYDNAGTWLGEYTYSPYGETRSVGDDPILQANQYRYIGGEYENGIYRFGARYYDPSLGAFTQMDPSDQETSPYAYAASDPVNRANPPVFATHSLFSWTSRSPPSMPLRTEEI